VNLDKKMAGVNQARTSNQSKTLFPWLTKGNSLKNSSTYGIRTSQVGAGSGSKDCIMYGDGQGGGRNSGHDGSDIGSNYIGGCGGVGDRSPTVGGETGSDEDGTGDRVMDTSDSDAGGGGSGITHTSVNRDKHICFYAQRTAVVKIHCRASLKNPGLSRTMDSEVEMLSSSRTRASPKVKSSQSSERWQQYGLKMKSASSNVLL